MNVEQSSTQLEESYLALVEFLLLSKRKIVELGATYDLTAMQAMTIFLLDGPRPMRDFTTIFNCDPSNVTGIIDGLELKELAERSESPTDRRIKLIQLKPAGSTIRTALLQQLVGPDCYLLGNLTPEEATQFIALTQKITRPGAA